jgi:RNA polymerase-binding transcription factor DksA
MGNLNHWARKRLLAHRKELLIQIKRLEKQHYERGGLGNHSADAATEAFERARDQAVARCLEACLCQVEAALGKVGTSAYGSCERCGAKIDVERLRFLPEARYCRDCQQLAEIDGKPLRVALAT